MKIINLIEAGYPLVWVETAEPHRAERALGEKLIKQARPCYRWDVRQGGPVSISESDEVGNPDPAEAIQEFVQQDSPNAVLFLWNFHFFIEAPEVIQTILNSLASLQGQGKVLIVLAPVVKIPQELEKFITVTDFALPSEEDLISFVKSFLGEEEITDEKAQALARAGLGLTKFEFMSALALSLQEKGELDPHVVWAQKAQLVRKNEVLEMFQPSELDRFEFVGGLDNLKTFLATTAGKELARGVMLLGVPGTGKSAIAKALGNEIGLPVLALDFGRCFGSLVGQSEARVRAALRVVDAMAPCILFIDEIEKGLSGVASSHQTDGGTGARVFGTFLQWLNDRRSQVYVIATCNDISKLPPEFLRAERWDAIFFVDLPSQEEREQIWQIWLNHYGIEEDAPRPDDRNWTGAEIKTCCRLAALMKTTPQEAAKFVVPVARSMGEKITQLREWAKNRCVPASISVPVQDHKQGQGRVFV